MTNKKKTQGIRKGRNDASSSHNSPSCKLGKKVLTHEPIKRKAKV